MRRRILRRVASCQFSQTLGALALVVPTALISSCGAPLQRVSTYELPMVEARDTLTVADVVDWTDSLEATPVAEEVGDYAGLNLLFPEIVELDETYRSALEAIWSEDLEVAESGLAVLDSTLAEVNDAVHPLAAVYFQNLGARVERLKELVQESRYFEAYIARVDSLGVISGEGEVDSTALLALLEKPSRDRSSDPRYDMELVENPLTERWVRYFTGDGRRYMDLWMSRKPLYEEIVYEILDEYDVPREMIYLAMIESGLSMKARSYANAVGPWQFISSTGRLYGLKIDWWVDERRHLEKATRAAASHLSDLYESFGSWPLALAAYNCGIRRVERAIRRHGTRDFWQLSSLPRQTRNYVPKFMAAHAIGMNPEAFGFKAPQGDKLQYDLVRVDDATELRLVAELAGASLDSIVELNPHLRRWSTPPGETYDIKVPKGVGETVAEKLAQVPPEERVSWRRHRVRKGETLSMIASNYGTNVTAVKQANGLRKNLIHEGSFLLIPVVSENPSSRVRESIAEVAKSGVGSSMTYVVRRGDTLSRIANRYGVSVRKIMEWNGKSNTRIHVGERLALHSAADGSKRITYIVRHGDTLSKIGKRHRVSVKQIMAWNQKRNTRIRVGERLHLYING